jgi:hypothetical protein
MNWKAWLKGLAAVAIGGAATGAAHAVGDGQVNGNTAITAGIGALATVLAYMMQSPLVMGAAGTAQTGAAQPGVTDSDPNAPNSPAGN